MGADRKGPLAAFIVIAIIAAILLVTSVRSQAAPALLTAAPADDVVVGQSPAASGARSSVGDDGLQEVHEGAVLGRRVSPAGAGEVTDPTPTTAGDPGPGAPVVAGNPPGRHTPHGRAGGHRGGHARHARSGGEHAGRAHAAARHHDREHHHGPIHQARALTPR